MSKAPDIMVLVMLGVLLAFHGPPNTDYLLRSLELNSSLPCPAIPFVLQSCCGVGLICYFVLAMSTATRWWSQMAKGMIVIIFAAAYVIMPALNNIWIRHEVGLTLGGKPVLAHDGGVLQTEAAMRLLMKGQPFYGADYHGTDMEAGFDSDPRFWKGFGFAENPALTYFPYPPGTVVLSLPLYRFSCWLLGWYDQRFMYLSALAALAVLGYCLPCSTAWKLPMAMVLAINPLGTGFYYVSGTNDTLCLAAVTATVFCLLRGRVCMASLLLGIACTCKQFAWPFLPFYLAYVFARQREPLAVALRRTLRGTWPLIVVVAAMLLPFLVWTPRAFIHDIFLAQSQIYPLRIDGYGGVSAFLYWLGFVRHPQDQFPLIASQAVLALPVCTIGVLRILRTRSLATTFMWYPVVLFITLFFNRYFALNYLAFLVSVSALSLAIADTQQQMEKPPGGGSEDRQVPGCAALRS